jgi:hypothetical protein
MQILCFIILTTHKIFVDFCYQRYRIHPCAVSFATAHLATLLHTICPTKFWCVECVTYTIHIIAIDSRARRVEWLCEYIYIYCWCYSYTTTHELFDLLAWRRWTAAGTTQFCSWNYSCLDYIYKKRMQIKCSSNDIKHISYMLVIFNLSVTELLSNKLSQAVCSLWYDQRVWYIIK